MAVIYYQSLKIPDPPGKEINLTSSFLLQDDWFLRVTNSAHMGVQRNAVGRVRMSAAQLKLLTPVG
jgi:hypothetical protein